MHKIRDAERREIRDILEAANEGEWVRIASEINYKYNEIYFWFQITDVGRLDRGAKKVLGILQRYALERAGAQFNAGFIELTDQEKINWETIDDDMIRRGRLGHPAGSNPWRSEKRSSSVFDRPEYSIPEEDEPI